MLSSIDTHPLKFVDQHFISNDLVEAMLRFEIGASWIAFQFQLRLYSRSHS
ncbi:hypothetical protein DsansV1_C09g0090171 [Dioscorea sansibarensis]